MKRERKMIMTAFSVLISVVLTACSGGGSGGGGAPASFNPTPTTTQVGVSNGAPAVATIGAAGGSVSSPDSRLALTIPPLALASDTVISIEPITNMAHGRIGSAYRLTPAGQSFLTPVTLTFTYTDQDMEGTSADVLGIAFQTAAGFWQWADNPTVDTTAKTVSVATNHFSDWSKVMGFQIRPAKKTVKVSTSLGLQVTICYNHAIPGTTSPSQPLGYNCDSDEDSATLNPVGDWSVNGVLGGGGTTGNVVGGSGNRATYTAPAIKPSPKNTVAVSAKVDRGASGTTLVVSNITIVGDSWTGTGSSTSAAMNVTAQVTWTLESMTNNVAVYRPTGSVSAVIPGCSINPSSNTLNPATDGVLFIDFNATPPTYHGSGTSSWAVTLTCPPADPSTLALPAPFFGGSMGTLQVEAQGTVSPDGVTIQGSDINTLGDPVTFNWNFTAD